MQDGHADGSYEDFLSGFVTREGQIWDQPIGVAIGEDGALYLTDDGHSQRMARCSYEQIVTSHAA